MHLVSSAPHKNLGYVPASEVVDPAGCKRSLYVIHQRQSAIFIYSCFETYLAASRKPKLGLLCKAR